MVEKKIGESIKAAIENSPFSVSEVAIAINTTSQNLYKLFKKDNVDTKYLVEIARVIDIPVSSFFDNSQSSKFSFDETENNLLIKYKNENEVMHKRILELEDNLEHKSMLLAIIKKTGAISFHDLITPKHKRGLDYNTDLNDFDALIESVKNTTKNKSEDEKWDYLEKLVEEKKKNKG
jgi:hypothetical protein